MKGGGAKHGEGSFRVGIFSLECFQPLKLLRAVSNVILIFYAKIREQEIEFSHPHAVSLVPSYERFYY